MDPHNGPAPAPATGTPNPAPAPAPAPTPAPAPGAYDGKWYKDFKTPEVQSWLHSYGDAYPDPEAVALKAHNLEKFIGLEKAGRGIVIPKADAKPEEWKAFYTKVGAPDKVEGYTVPDDLAKDPVMENFRKAAFDMHMPKPMFDNIIKFVSEAGTAGVTANMEALAQKSELEYQQITAEWGADAKRFEELGKRAARAFVPHSDAADLESKITQMEAVWGTKATLQFFKTLGEGLGEHKAMIDQGGPSLPGGAMSSEAAKAEISRLKQDKEWSNKYIAGDAEAKKKWDELHQLAYPGSASL